MELELKLVLLNAVWCQLVRVDKMLTTDAVCFHVKTVLADIKYEM